MQALCTRCMVISADQWAAAASMGTGAHVGVQVGHGLGGVQGHDDGAPQRGVQLRGPQQIRQAAAQEADSFKCWQQWRTWTHCTPWS